MGSSRELMQICGETNGANASVATVKLINTGDISHYHPIVKEIYYFTDGTGSINLNGDEIKVKKGDCIVIYPNNTHFVHTDSSISFVCVCIPPWNEECEVITEEAKGKEKLKFCSIGNILSENDVDISLLNGQYFNNSQDERLHIYCFIGNGYINVNGVKHFVKKGDCYAIPCGSDEYIDCKDDISFLLIGTIANEKVPFRTNINEVDIGEKYD